MELTNYSEYFRFLRVMGKSVQAARTLSAFAALIGVLVTWWVGSWERIAHSIIAQLGTHGIKHCALPLIERGIGIVATVNHLAARRASILLRLSCTALIAILTLLEYAVGFGFGIDFMVGDASLGSPNPYTGRMSLMTSFCFLITSSCLFAMHLSCPIENGYPNMPCCSRFDCRAWPYQHNTRCTTLLFTCYNHGVAHHNWFYHAVALAYFGLRQWRIGRTCAIENAGWQTYPAFWFLSPFLYPILSVIRLWAKRAGTMQRAEQLLWWWRAGAVHHHYVYIGTDGCTFGSRERVVQKFFKLYWDVGHREQRWLHQTGIGIIF